ncbi:hypothetical protein HC248_01393 [Polaromonas vacuolata]|uniref:Uncharacterized protein n=1 Tax=Polaromonas vacuolata TaxID=37448 RepID=A0A6H2H8K8_9BURK|nr:hypothetical protein HC248_01393 [Polaromonas vacuolata]
MTQTRLGSLIESLINVLVGFVISLVLTAIVLPAYGHEVTLVDNLQITLIFTLSSIGRSYLLRRYFNASIHHAAHQLVNKGSRT